MKTKVNEIPLVGPKGRKGLIDRINDLNARLEAVESKKAEKHILSIVDWANDDNVEDTLACLRLDGNAITLDDLKNLDMNNTLVFNDSYGYFLPTTWYHNENMVSIGGGIWSNTLGATFYIYINNADDLGKVQIYEY